MGATVTASSPLEAVPLPAVALGVALGVINVLLFWPLLIRFLPVLRYWAPIHYRPISDIPVRCWTSISKVHTGLLGVMVTSWLDAPDGAWLGVQSHP